MVFPITCPCRTSPAVRGRGDCSAATRGQTADAGSEEDHRSGSLRLHHGSADRQEGPRGGRCHRWTQQHFPVYRWGGNTAVYITSVKSLYLWFTVIL